MNPRRFAACNSAPLLYCRTCSAVAVVLLLLLTTGCTNLNGTRFEKLLGKDADLIDFSYQIADTLVERSMPPMIPRHPDMPVLVTTFVDNNDLTRTSPFGRLLQEHITSRLVQLGYTVREIKLTGTLSIEPKSGETVLSRDLAKIVGGQPAQAILAGTVARSDRELYVSARLIAPENSNIIASCDHQLYMDDNILAMFGLRTQDEGGQPITEPRQPRRLSVFW
jgi:TolB-like protein